MQEQSRLLSARHDWQTRYDTPWRKRWRRLQTVFQADSRCCGRILLVDATFGLAIQNNNTDTPVNGGGGIIFNQTDGRNQAPYPFDLRLGHAARPTFLASRIGTLDGKLTVTLRTE